MSFGVVRRVDMEILVAENLPPLVEVHHDVVVQKCTYACDVAAPLVVQVQVDSAAESMRSWWPLLYRGRHGLTLGRSRCTGARMKNRGLVLFTLLLSGCYTTKVYTPAPAHGPELRDRQWFTLGGLVSLSEPTGQQCPAGVSRAESELAVVDVLINVGLAVVGGVAGAVICNSESESDQRACGSAGAGLVPFLFASRTVQYTCAGPGAPVPPGAPGTLSSSPPSPPAPPGG